MELSNQKIHHFSYTIAEVEPYINWPYFYHAWGLSGKPPAEQQQLQREAQAMLRQFEQQGFQTRAICGLFEANSQGDDIMVGQTCIPMLRQQHPTREGQPNLCLADFIRPAGSGQKDTIGIFAATMPHTHETQANDDPYQKMMVQTLADRLAEATAELMHLQVRRHLWGYAPDEQLTMPQLLNGAYQGIRPAVGYPSLPDTSVNFIIDQLIGFSTIGIRLTESGMMVPRASVSGFMFAHPQAHYFDLGKIGDDQLHDYARRRGLPAELMRRFLNYSLLKK